MQPSIPITSMQSKYSIKLRPRHQPLLVFEQKKKSLDRAVLLQLSNQACKRRSVYDPVTHVPFEALFSIRLKKSSGKTEGEDSSNGALGGGRRVLAGGGIAVCAILRTGCESSGSTTNSPGTSAVSTSDFARRLFTDRGGTRYSATATRRNRRHSVRANRRNSRNSRGTSAHYRRCDCACHVSSSICNRRRNSSSPIGGATESPRSSRGHSLACSSNSIGHCCGSPTHSAGGLSMLLDMFRNLRGARKKTYGTKTLTDLLADRFGTTLGGDQGGEENSESVVGELHDCGVLW